MTKVYFETEEEAVAANYTEAESRGCDMLYTTMWWAMGEDEKGWYLVMTVEERDEQGLT
jgi:ornithine carbamoyltransferase